MGCNGCGHNKLSQRLKSNGDIHFVKKGPEPPPDLKGYKRDTGDDWLFHPVTESYLPCYKAIAFTVKDKNGISTMGRLCTHPEIKATEVSFADCKSCPLRRDMKPSKQRPVKVGGRKTILQRIMSHIIEYA